MTTTRRPLEELKRVALELAAKLKATPSRKQLAEVVKPSEYSYYGMTVKEFQRYCGLEE